MNWRRSTASVAVGLVLVAGCGSDSGGSGSLPAPDRADLDAAEKYCTEQGGELVTRAAVADTNEDPANWVRLGREMTLCEFESTADGNTTRISVDLVTLHSEQPTLAALAYLSKVVPTLPPQPSANPAAYNCAEGLNGARDFGNTAGSSGGWVDETQETFVVMELCVFADMSAIDEWGITYYAQGVVRGADLATKFRYQPDDALPPVFVAGDD